MPKDCQYLRAPLQYEHLRFEDWCEAAGFHNTERIQKLPESLTSAGLVLGANLTEMQLVMDGLAEMAEKHKQLKGNGDADATAEMDEVQITQKLHYLTFRDRRGINQDSAAEPPDAKPKGKQRWMSMATNLKAIAKDRGRFTW